MSPAAIIFPYAKYAGSSASVTKGHEWRTAANSCAYLLPHLEPSMRVLDVGCGPGTISCDLAANYLPRGHVTGVDASVDCVEKAAENAQQRGIENISFTTGDIFNLPFPDNTFDVVHEHQVLQHIYDPAAAIEEMRRVAKPGGLVACRESIMDGFLWYPLTPDKKEWWDLYVQVVKSHGANPGTGRMLHVFARQAGFSRDAMTSSSSAWCYCDEKERKYWGDHWADRMLTSAFRRDAVSRGFCTNEDMDRYARLWREWGAQDEGSFILVHAEILCRVDKS
ncbi:methyltransferase type 11 [Paecilomyces variotii]|uniref:Methyltransferase type 11 n=1 Tax=Byssochlamys spectabilis TaxID=264951 RepID=A0A443HR98_BYSSP|nr:methyltransferase type 11 [Paecilomyces variotii]KAJ9365695.1 hypothetical protein DTO280E4_664 [Paecilomyces variotii]RWQ94335.1 methyltransferase type 11 [Paecilomyces variotii]